MNRNYLVLSFIVAMSMIFAGCSSQSDAQTDTGAEGYRAVASADDCFIAVGTGGRIDRINFDDSYETYESAITETLNAVDCYNGVYFAVGNNGTIVSSSSSEVSFGKKSSGTREDLLAAAGFKGGFFAAGRGGLLLRSVDGDKWNKVDINVENDIVTMAANDGYLFALTREGQIISSIDGETFSVQNYNEEFEGYNEYKYWFENITSLGETFFITGSLQGYEDVPMIMMSSTGEVWMPRAISEINDKPSADFLPLKLGQVGIGGGELVAPVNGGRIISITDCSSCNILRDVDNAEITGLAYDVDWVMLVGEGFWFDCVESDSLIITEAEME
ncbi:MAG: hypothetical protein LBL49_08825 [Clostridiales Family XIII bacterium]|nr:hypothetical protein [Clostridiales Family XIII bacterium]